MAGEQRMEQSWPKARVVLWHTPCLLMHDVKLCVINSDWAKSEGSALRLRFDDTSVRRKAGQFEATSDYHSQCERAIVRDLEAIGVEVGAVSRSSQYVAQLVKIAEEMIVAGKLYCDDTSPPKMRDDKVQGIASPHRLNTPARNLQMFQEMKIGTPAGVRTCVRAKIDMQSKSCEMRDPVMLRVVVKTTRGHYTSRPVVTREVVPTADFSHPLIDVIEGMTRVTLQESDKPMLYQWVQTNAAIGAVAIKKIVGWKLEHTTSNLDHLSAIIAHFRHDASFQTHQFGDARMPTVQGLLRRGMHPQSFALLARHHQTAKTCTHLSHQAVWSANTKLVDFNASRYSAIEVEGCVHLRLRNGPIAPLVKCGNVHRLNAGLGRKAVVLANRVLVEGRDAEKMTVGVHITLFEWCNAVVEEADGKEATVYEGFVKDSLKVHWLADTDDVVQIRAISYPNLLTVAKPREEDKIEAMMNEEQPRVVLMVGDGAMRAVKRGQFVQFLRKGLYRCEEPFLRKETAMVFVEVP